MTAKNIPFFLGGGACDHECVDKTQGSRRNKHPRSSSLEDVEISMGVGGP